MFPLTSRAVKRHVPAITRVNENLLLADATYVRSFDRTPRSWKPTAHGAGPLQAADHAGCFTEAIALHKSTVADAERVLGASQPDTLAFRNDLGAAYHWTRSRPATTWPPLTPERAG